MIIGIHIYISGQDDVLHARMVALPCLPFELDVRYLSANSQACLIKYWLVLTKLSKKDPDIIVQ